MKISPLLLFIVLLFASLKAQGPLTWNINSSYTHPALVINGSTTYISLKDVPSGISITSNSYWSTLDSYIPTETPSGSDAITTPDASEVEGLTVPPSVSHDNFYFGFSHIKEEGASDFLLNSVGIKEYSEWQSPPLTYFGPSANGNESILTYKFEFSGDVVSARARVNLGVWNFNAPGAFGSGQGTASAWASTDGQAWVNLINLPVPQTFSSGQTFEDMLPESVLGTKEIYLQIRMEVSGAPNSSYTTAQFGRSDANAPKDIFYLDANYSSAVSQSNGLVAYYPFDGNASDMSGNGNNGTVYGATLAEDRYGQSSNAYSFDGISDYIEVGYSSSMNTSAYTVSAWVKPTEVMSERPQYQNVASVITSRDDSPVQGYMLYQYSDDRWRSQSGGNSWWYSTYGLDVRSNKWINLIMTHSSQEGATRLYENGVLVGVSNETFIVNNSKPLRIGGGATESLTPKYFFPGSIDDIRIYNRALSSTEVNELYELEKPFDPNEGLVAYFPFDGNASDMSGNGNDGTVYGATLSADRNGDASKAYTFDGVNDYIKVGGPSSLTNGVDQTIAFWVKGTGLAYWNDDTQPGGDTRFTITDDGRLNFWANNDWNLIFTDQSIETSSWHHIAITMKNGNRYRLFYDGDLFFNVDDTKIYNHDGRTGIYIGSGHPGVGQGFFEGSIDEVRHYVRTLSDREVAALYAIERPKRVDITTGLVAYYPFDGNASDMSGNGNNGTVYGATLSNDRNGDAGNSYFFDGVNDWIEVENHESFNFAANDPFTISAWVKPHQLSSKYSPKSIIEKWSESGGYPFVLRSYQDSGEKTIGFGRYDGSSGVGVQIKDDNLLSAFGHVTAVSDGMKVAIFYNGLEQDSKDFSLSDTKNNSSLFFGKRGPNLEFFNGSIDDVRIYNRALSSTEVYELYELEKPFDPNEGLVAYFPFDGNALDMSGNGNDGTVYGATLSTDRNGDANKAYSFDGVNDWIGLSQQIPDLENFTLSAWFKGKGSIFQDETETSGNDFGIFFHGNDGTFRIRNTKGGSGFSKSYIPDDYLTYDWNQVIFSLSANNVLVSFNGEVIEYEGTFTGNIGYHSSEPRIGTYNYFGNSNFFDGSIDDLRLYDRALSRIEVSKLWELERPRFDFAHCMEKLPGGSLIAIPKGYTAPGGLTLKSRGEEYDLYEVTGMVTTMEQTIETGKALGRIEGKSEVLANPSAYGLFTESDLNSTRENAWSEGQMIGRSFGELSVINQPGSFGLKSEADFYSAKSNALIEGHSEILDKVVNIVKSIADTNELDIPDSLRTYSYSDFVDENGSVYLDEIEFAIEQFIDFADSATTSPYTNGWFYSRNLGWMWTDKTVFPYFFRSEGGWIYFKKGFNQPRFYNYETKKWFDVKE